MLNCFEGRTIVRLAHKHCTSEIPPSMQMIQPSWPPILKTLSCIQSVPISRIDFQYGGETCRIIHTKSIHSSIPFSPFSWFLCFLEFWISFFIFIFILFFYNFNTFVFESDFVRGHRNIVCMIPNKYSQRYPGNLVI